MSIEKLLKYGAILVLVASIYFIGMDLLQILSDRYNEFISNNWYFVVSALLSGYVLIRVKKKHSQ